MFLQCCLNRFIELTPLYVAQRTEVLCLPPPLCIVAKDSIAFDASIRSTLTFKTRTCWTFSAGKLGTEFLEAAGSRPI